jgi:hypothetical protein
VLRQRGVFTATAKASASEIAEEIEEGVKSCGLHLPQHALPQPRHIPRASGCSLPPPHFHALLHAV